MSESQQRIDNTKSDTKAEYAIPFLRIQGKNSILKMTSGREIFDQIK